MSKGAHQFRKSRVTVHMEDNLHVFINEEAAKRNISMSEYLRALALKERNRLRKEET